MRIRCNQTEDEEEKTTLTSIDPFDLEEICPTRSGAFGKPLTFTPPSSHSGHQNQSCHAPLQTHPPETVAAGA